MDEKCIREGSYLEDPREDNIKINNVKEITFKGVDLVHVAQEQWWTVLNT
jgi:hypothetical protein